HVPEPNWRDKLIWLGALSAFFLAIIGVIAFVNAELRKKVAEKTESLETEIAIRRAHEEALQKQENFLSTMAQTVPGIIVVLDLERMIPTYLNRDISPLDIVWEDVEKRGEDVLDVFCPPEERERVRAFYKGMRDAGVGESREIDHRYETKEGEVSWLHIGARPLERDEKGEVTSVVLAITDITELKRINRELDEQKRLLEKIAKTLPDLIYIFDYNERRYVYTNRPPRIEGKPDGVSGSSFIDMIAAPEDRERAEAFIASLRDADDEGVYEFEHRALNEKGERRWIFSVNRVFARNERGEVTQLVGTARDVTELKRATEEIERANERLREANATKDKLFSIVAHDLRGPFNGLIGYTDYLTGIDPSDCPEEIKRVARKLNEEALATFRLLDNLLQWSRLQSGRLEFTPESFSFVEAVECAVAAARSQAKSKDVSLTLYVEPSIKTYADPFAVETIVRNLYSNAIKFSDAGASVLTRAEERGEFVVVEIADEGVGMTPEQLDALFDLGSGVSRRGTAGEKGTGLGLTLCKEFVERSGGTIEVESVLGVGSVFRFTLPRG
ncbi:MAG: PAS domain S-box protein, partial [Ignavibacteriales bacterium]|nr:PAS domain S-box protein [Ignavibacteriales bacterium]